MCLPRIVKGRETLVPKQIASRRRLQRGPLTSRGEGDGSGRPRRQVKPQEQYTEGI